MTDVSTHSTHLLVPLRARTLSRHTGDACYACCEPSETRSRPFCSGCGCFYPVHGEHRGDCTADDATRLHLLRSEITAICEQIDRRNGTTPGTAERGIYFWFWPRTDDLATLTALHADAVTYLANLIEGKTE